MNKKKDAEMSDYVFGKVAPQSVEMEQAVLGAIMLDKDIFAGVSDILRPSDFYSDAHAEVFRAFEALSSKFAPIDLLTVTEQLKTAGKLDFIGGGYYLVEMTNRVGSSANVMYHAGILKELSIRRSVLNVGMGMVRDAYDDTIMASDLLQSSESGIFSVSNSRLNNGATPISNTIVENLKRLDEARKQKDGLTGVPSGFSSIDRLTGGWQNSDLIIIAARPGMGKTSYALDCAMNAAKNGFPVLFFSLEMSKEQLTNRLISSMARVSGNNIMRGRVSNDEMGSVVLAAERISELPIYIDDTPALSVLEMRSRSRSMCLKHGIKMILTDYLQLMVGEKSNSGNRENEIGSISRGLKGIAKEVGVPVLALSQLSRAVETRGGDKRPILSDLRDSGSIEQDADMVQFIYRPEYYGITEDSSGKSTTGLAEIIFAKNRNGKVGIEELAFEGMFTSFSDKAVESFNPDKPVKSDSDPFSEPFAPQKVLTTPSKTNDDFDIPF